VRLDHVLVAAPIVFNGLFNTVDFIDPGFSPIYGPGVIGLRKGLWNADHQESEENK
jgi:hypothetical protein